MAPSVRLARRVLRSDGSPRVLSAVRLLVVALVLIFATQVANAWQVNDTGTCYESSDCNDNTCGPSTPGQTWHPTHGAACSAYFQKYVEPNQGKSCGQNCVLSYEQTACGVNYYSGQYRTMVTYKITRRQTNGTLISTTSQNIRLARRSSSNQAQCVIDSTPPPDNHCAGYKGKYKNFVEPTTANLGKTSCVAGCEFKASNFAIKRTDGQYQWRAQVSGEMCGGGGSTAPTDTDDSNENCATTSGGATFCAPHDKKNCGYYNNEYVCVNSTPPDNCVETASGRRFCGPQAPTPPVPDTGTPGQKAPPQDTLETVNNEASAPGGANSETPPINHVNNVYGANQVAGSSRDPGGSGTTGNTPGPGGSVVGGGGDDIGDTDGDGTGEGEGEGEGGVPCDGEQCAFVPPELTYTYQTGDGTDADSDAHAAAIINTQSKIMEAPIVEAIVGVAATWPSGGGACPRGTLNLNGVGLGTHDLMDWGCDLWANDIAPMLYILMTALWSFIGLRIMLEA